MLKTKKLLTIYVRLICIGFFVQSCSYNVEQKNDEKRHKTDTLTVSVPSSENKNKPESLFFSSSTTSNYKYSYYKPKNEIGYAIYFIDSHGRDLETIKKYKELADTFGITLIGINSIKNGLPELTVSKIWNGIKNDATKKLKLNSQSMIIGFSGGARYATFLADQDTSITNVTACSAGFYKDIKNHYDIKFNYLGIVGNKDFNYVEMMTLENKLQPYPRTQFMFSWDGKHEWPDVRTLNYSFNWFFNTLLKKDLIRSNESLIKERFKNISPGLIKIPQSNQPKLGINLISELQKTELMLFIFDGLVDCSEFLQHRSDIYRPDQFKNQLAQHKVDLYYESKQQQIFLKSLTDQDTIWWKKQIHKGTFRSPTYNNIHKRLLQYCGLQLYFMCHQTLKNKQLKEFDKYTWLYVNIDPENNEAHYLRSISSALSNDKVASLASIDSAISYGFSDYYRITNQIEFKSLLRDTEFKNVISPLK